MKATVDRDLCTACGLCAETCPAVFELDDEGIAKAKGDVVPSGEEAACKEAAENCPVEAITIEE